MKTNFFITLEGVEGVGKSTALNYIKNYLTEKNIDFTITREPGGTDVAESLRKILLHHEQEAILPITELLLLFAGRAQHIAHVIQPALDNNKWVISDRFTDASFAYQGGGRQMSMTQLKTLSEWVQGDLQPDLTLLFDAPVEVGLSRMTARGEKDRIEKEKTDFFERVRATYLERAKQFPARFVIIDATQSLESVQQQIKTALEKL
ncbi:MAG: dTMP kinase [Gammaproteobacteria bacterium]|nr:dTMP kinase [Gammaproteobacteria bacterium]